MNNLPQEIFMQLNYFTIGVGAQIATGKDTLADYLVTKLNLRYKDPNNMWVRNAFAKSVKDIYQTAFGVDKEFIEKYKRIDTPPPGFGLPVRDSLITIGDGFRQMKSNVWIENAFRNQQNHQIISDCRYRNESHRIRELGGLTILMWRPEFENDIDNPSEQELTPFIKKLKPMNFDGIIPTDFNIPFDLWIRNDGTIEDLYQKVDSIVIPFIDNFWGFEIN